MCGGESASVRDVRNVEIDWFSLVLKGLSPKKEPKEARIEVGDKGAFSDYDETEVKNQKERWLVG